ncbi:PAS domain-containing protein [Azospirillum brasilense]|uniref:PAS domain-containing protein n=1 Tax=Azospirillum brasilense TaxID=192 RepID=UPI001EDC6065|nr:PAS domain-containing protein [Azospirillum brasilense]UKJ76870.1 PAS domain-containing protein [Azospirillum brasilense]
MGAGTRKSITGRNKGKSAADGSDGARTLFQGDASRIDIEIAHALWNRWLRKMAMYWGNDAPARIRLVEEEASKERDLFRLAVQSIESDAPPEKMIAAAMAKVQHPDYAITDLFIELSSLEDTFNEVLHDAWASADDIEHTMSRMRHVVRSTLLRVLEGSAEVHEAALETGNRGYCLLDAEGFITFANKELNRMLGVASARDHRLVDFLGDGAHIVDDALAGRADADPDMHILRLRRPDDTTLPVGISVGRVVREGNLRGYAILSDLSRIVREELRIFDMMPLGVLLCSPTLTILHANPKLREIFGVPAEMSVEGKSVWDFVTDAQARTIIEGNLSELGEGLSGEYALPVRRLNDQRPLQVMVAAAPIRDTTGSITAILAVVRNLELETIADAIHKLADTAREPEQLLIDMADAMRTVVPFDAFSVSLFTADKGEKDRHHARTLISYPDKMGQHVRWQPISPLLAVWLMEPKPRAIPDFRAFLAQETMSELRDSPDCRDYLMRGYQSLLVCSIRREGGIAATVAWHSKSLDFYGEAHRDALSKLPIDKTVDVALAQVRQRAEKFRSNLILQASAARNVDDMAKCIVKELVKHYGWQNAALFEVDTDQGVFILRQQAMGALNGYLQPLELTQSINGGILGRAYREGRPVSLSGDDVHGGSGCRPGPNTPLARSGLALPISMDGQVRWILSIEDRQENAFSACEQAELISLFESVRPFLENLMRYCMLYELLRVSQDLIVITNEDCRIIEINPAGAKMLGRQKQDSVGKDFQRFLKNTGEGIPQLRVDNFVPTKTELRFPMDGDGDGNGNGCEDAAGKTVTVLLSGRKMPDFGRRVFFGREWGDYRRYARTDDIKDMFHEIVNQTRPALSMVAGTLSRLARKARSEEWSNEVPRMMRYLRRMDMPFDRLLLYNHGEGAVPYVPVRLSMRQLVEEIIASLPSIDAEAVDLEFDTTDGIVRADPFQISFVIETILSYLLRNLPDEAKVTIGIQKKDNDLILCIEGPLPTESNAEPENGTIDARTALARARLRAELALGEATIRRFVQRNQGEYRAPEPSAEVGSFEIRLPLEHVAGAV